MAMTDRALERQGEAVEAGDVVRGGRWPKETLVSLIAFFVLWHFASMVLPPFVAPSWARIGRSLLDIATRPEFIAITVGRVAVALVVSFVLGMALAMAMYWWTVLERYLMPLIQGEDYPKYKDGMPVYATLKNVAVAKKLPAFSIK